MFLNSSHIQTQGECKRPHQNYKIKLFIRYLRIYWINLEMLLSHVDDQREEWWT